MPTVRSRKRGLNRAGSQEADQNQVQALETEINSLSAHAHRVAEMAREADNLKEAVMALNAVGAAFTRLARLLESQKKLSGGGRSEYELAMDEIIARLHREDEEEKNALEREAANKDKKKPGSEKSSPAARSKRQKRQKEAAPLDIEKNHE
jgi:hypothetical protein